MAPRSKANASKHKAVSWAYANKLEEPLAAEVEELLRKAEDADNTALPEEMDVAAELVYRQPRLNTIAQARQRFRPERKSALSANKLSMKKR